MCIVISGQDGIVEQARGQFEDLVVPVWAVLDYTEMCTISRELLFVKVSIVGPGYLEDQLEGGPSHEPQAAHGAHAEQTKLEREMTLAGHFEDEPVRQRHQYLHSLHTLANQFCARFVDMTGKTARVKASFYPVKPFDHRIYVTGAFFWLIAMPCTRIAVGSIVDASLLPPI
ncbi:hypothetical protein EDB85DRAFT_2032640 [Lactarius pseudohatsudake]|nr:hypothetical protein EDB85DRAFT_2032640 [Lactarius pseudohatsudake]